LNRIKKKEVVGIAIGHKGREIILAAKVIEMPGTG
jgi:hypothetical protein